ncbi:pyridoxamine 5'-phosphate oxidase family protein [Kitasatospora sp. NPDC051853]|uniref:pyridoxamine 5'-phosphate oxidase family protein n=1 Tax=Kitasatospora sp. NPDC051853 TaxID=3364058 RepID=UPI0037A030F3
MTTAYHRGELAVQDRAELSRQAGFSLGGIGTVIPPVAAEFLAAQPMVVIGGTDRDGRVWATQLSGAPGFLRAPDERTLSVAARPGPQDPLAEVLAGPARIGMIAIEPATRRRMRINGRSVPDGDGLRVDLDQVIANCPKYIQKRDHRPLLPGEEGSGRAPRAVDSAELTEAQQRWIRGADTFFVATASDRGDADASHRGGNPGFLRVLSPTRLRWPDYVGNAMFLTLGNLELNPAAGIVVPGWESGSSLHLTGTARTVWDAEPIAEVPGAQRLVEFEVTAVREVSDAAPLRWSAPEASRFNPPVAPVS